MIEPHGDVVVLRAITAQGRTWAERHVSAEGWQRRDMGARFCEPGTLPAVLRAAVQAGLRVSIAL